jgi:hypothetical protein
LILAPQLCKFGNQSQKRDSVVGNEVEARLDDGKQQKFVCGCFREGGIPPHQEGSFEVTIQL